MAKKMPPEGQDVTEPLPGMPNPIEQAQMDKKKAMPKPEKPIKKMAKGGTASSRADGCCTKGKTRGKMV